MGASLSGVFSVQQFTDMGTPLVGGRLYTYAAGTTSSKTAYTDPAGTIAHTYTSDGAGGLYIALDARGELPAPLYLTAGAYDLALRRADGSAVWTRRASGVTSDLAESGGSTLVGFVQSGTGAIQRTMQDKAREPRSIEDYGATVDTAFPAAAAACKAAGGGEFRASGVAYSISSALKICGDYGDGMVYDGKRARITAPAGAGAYFVGNEVGNIASSYFNKYTLRNLVGVGGGTGGTDGGYTQQAAADINVDGGHFRNFGIGLKLSGALTSDYRGITVRANGVGVKADYFDDGAGGLNSFSPNANSFYGLRCYHNDIGIQYLYNPSGVANWIGSNFEDNNSAGNTADGKKVVELTNAGHHNFIGCHFEANKGQYGIHFTGYDNSKNLLMLGCEVIDAVDNNLFMARGRLTSVGSRITNTSSTNDIYLDTGARATLIDTEGVLAGDLSAVACIRDGRIGFGAQPINTSPLIDMQSAAITASSNVALNMRNDTVQVRFQNTAGTRVGYIQTSSAGDHILNNDNAEGGWSIRAGNGNRLFVGRSGASTVEAGADNAISLGTASFRFSVVYAATGTINTSDERAKEQIGAAPNEWLDAWADVQWTRYKLRDAVAAKGAGARWHTGLIAQRVEQAFASRGLDARDIGLLCWDSWPAQDEIRDESGAVVQEQIPAGERYGVRYEEALALEAALMRRTTERLERRLAALEAA